MIKLWNQTMPHRCVEDAFEPYLTPYDCDAAKTAIVVCPGGAYCGRADYEGNDVGVWLNTIGITAFVLEYRVAPSKAPAQPSDAQRAMRLARKLCMERGIERLGIMGFSAGGHLAATLSVHYDEAFYPPQDELDNLSACPDFTVLCYSVIDMGEYRHDWSRRFLLGDVPDEAQIEFYSPQRCVTENTPPAFLWHTCHGSHGFLRFLFLHFTNSRFYFQVVIATILAGFATTSCALLLNTNCRFPSLLVNFTLILHPLENWINRTNPVVSYYAKRTCISACAL